MANERQRLLAVTILAGGLCGLSAVAFHLTIAWLENLMINRANFAHGHTWIFWTILTPGIGGLIVRSRTHILGASCGGFRHSAGKGRIYAAFGTRFAARNNRQIRALRISDWLGCFAGTRRTDGADLRRREQPVGARRAAQPDQLQADGLGGNGGRDRRGVQRADCRDHIHAWRS